jgi:hypothetical protein
MSAKNRTEYGYDPLNRLDKLTHYASDSTPNDLSDNPKLAEFDDTVRPDGRRTRPEYSSISRHISWAGLLSRCGFDEASHSVDQNVHWPILKLPSAFCCQIQFLTAAAPFTLTSEPRRRFPYARAVHQQ